MPVAKRPLQSRPERRSTYALRIARKRMAMVRHGYDRVFGIGETKTATSSFGAAMELLGFRRHVGWDPNLFLAHQRGQLDPILDVARHYEVFEDLPWGEGDLYKVLDAQFPRARFVLTVRDFASWAHSHERHWGPEGTLPEWLRIDDYSERREEIGVAYLQRNDEIRAHFADRPGRLLVLDIAGGEDWSTLCPFLGLPVPPEPFPVLNVARVKR